LLQGYVEHQGDGWSYTLDYLDRHFERSLAGEPDTEATGGAHGGYLALVRKLGQRTAELHAALATSSNDAAFTPEPIGATDIASWAARARRQAEHALLRLEQRKAALPEVTRVEADLVLARRKDLLARVDAHSRDAARGAKTRVHGDYHLAQVLVVENDFYITDFEGEPTRTLDERREKISPAKDVAGMLRSFDYALNAALVKAQAKWPEARESLERVGRSWREQASRTFLEGYAEAAREASLAAPEPGGLLELFTLEKAFYELAYEVDNRPDWALIPLRGIAAILGGS
jgi:maltose alpha-D-glucosyltransferase/alpha-amylase